MWGKGMKRIVDVAVQSASNGARDLQVGRTAMWSHNASIESPVSAPLGARRSKGNGGNAAF